MKAKARKLFLQRLAKLRSLGTARVTLTKADAQFLDGLTTEVNGTIYYDGMEVRIIDKPEPATITK